MILIDGFITTSAQLCAPTINSRGLDDCVSSGKSDEQGPRKMSQFMNASAVLKLRLRLGEGTGAAIVYFVLKGALAVRAQMTTFEEAQAINTSPIRPGPTAGRLRQIEKVESNGVVEGDHFRRDNANR